MHKGIEIERCPECGVHYDDFRTGHTFEEVRMMLWVFDADSTKWKYKRRRCVLREWRKIKTLMWEYHIATCGGDSLMRMPASAFERIPY